MMGCSRGAGDPGRSAVPRLTLSLLPSASPRLLLLLSLLVSLLLSDGLSAAHAASTSMSAHTTLPASLPASVKAAAAPALSSYEHTLELDPSYRLFWTVDAATSRIQLAVSARTAGYVALGLSEVGAMVGTGEREGG